MKESQPAERIWSALKRTAATERGSVNQKQAIKRVQRIVEHEGGGELPDPALRFYAAEYVRMVRERVLGLADLSKTGN
jgi:hypothetical protein